MTNRDLFLKHVAQTSDSPLMFEASRADGVYIYGEHDKKYIDLISGISVSNLGHNHPEIVQAAKNQLNKYMHLMVYGEYVQPIQVEFAKLLVDQLPEPLKTVYFVNSGSEATEGAMKLAKRYTGRKEIIACNNAYHGHTHGAMSLMSNLEYSSTYGPLLEQVKFIEFNNFSDLQNITNKTAAVIIEPIQGEAGVKIPDENYLQKLRERCDETGTLLIFDEIQTGFGRTGKLFAFEHYHVIPDIILLAKALGGGMPIGAFISSPEIMKVLSHNPVLGHITTFGGHPVSCATGLKHLQLLLKDDQKIIKKVNDKAAFLKELLSTNYIKEIRNKGLLMAIEFENAKINHEVISTCYQNGILTDWFLYADNCLRIAPPLIISEAEIETACEIINKAIAVSS